MDLFATLTLCHVKDQDAIEQIMALRDKRWLASLGLKGSRFSLLPKDCIQQDEDGKQADPNLEMAALEETFVTLAMKTHRENERPMPLTMRLIRESLALTKKTSRRARSIKEEDNEVKAMLKKRSLRLDWLDIGKIDNLDAFTHVEELYLQYNLIETIENLDTHHQLTFLALAGNRIRHVQNLKQLHNLKFLDLSMNYIEKVDVSELPQSLCVLRLAGNPFVKHMPAYAGHFFEKLPNLVQIDQFRRPPLLEMAPVLASSYIESESSDSDVAVMSLPISQSPMEQSCTLQAEGTHPFLDQHGLHEQDRTRIDIEKSVEFNWVDYAKQHEDRMATWQKQLTTLTSQTRQQVAESDAMLQHATSSKLQEKRHLALSRVRLATDAALVDASSHTKQMEMAYQEWQARQSRPTFSHVDEARSLSMQVNGF